MAIPPSGGNNRSLYCLRFFLRQQQRKCHALAEESQKPVDTLPQILSKVIESKARARVDMKKWRKLDTKSLGIDYGSIPQGPWTIMKLLRLKGYDAYLVGGCVRDILLKKTPKDFDVITNATLAQIKNEFHRADIVGRRFPICMVQMRNTVTEVSSFETVAQHEEKDEMKFSEAPRTCVLKDFTLWRNSLKRDFTINSLFLDPFKNKIYDYSSGITDLKFLKLRTIIPAKESFEEDCARIMRGLRIAGRLGLSFSKDTEVALRNLSPSIVRLARARLLMEVNYMLSYGAAEPSLCLLQKFNLLQILLPLQAVYLNQQLSTHVSRNSTMLMKLLSNLDKLVSCDHPSDCRLWVGVLAFHLALVKKPQDALVVLTLASVLYHGEWEGGIKYARENTGIQAHFKPELSGAIFSKSDEELSNEVAQLAAFVQATIANLTEEEALLDSMSTSPTSSFPGMIFIPRKVGQDVAELFHMLVERNPQNENKRVKFQINHHLLGKGFRWETRFAIGKIILETMGCNTLQKDTENIKEISNTLLEIGGEIKHKLSSLIKKHALSVQHKVSKGDTPVETAIETDGFTEDDFTLELGAILENGTEKKEISDEVAKDQNGIAKNKRRNRKRKDNAHQARKEEKGGEVRDNMKNTKKKQQKRKHVNESRQPGKKKATEKEDKKNELPGEILTSIPEIMVENGTKTNENSNEILKKKIRNGKKRKSKFETSDKRKETDLAEATEKKKGNDIQSKITEIKNKVVMNKKPVVIKEVREDKICGDEKKKFGKKTMSENKNPKTSEKRTIIQEEKNKVVVVEKVHKTLSSLFKF